MSREAARADKVSHYTCLADRWVYVDIDPDTEPDVVGDILEESTIGKLLELEPAGYYVVLPHACPADPEFVESVVEYIIAVKPLMRPGSKAILPNLLYEISLASFCAGKTPKWRSKYDEKAKGEAEDETALLRDYEEGDTAAVRKIEATLNLIAADIDCPSWQIWYGRDVIFSK